MEEVAEPEELEGPDELGEIRGAGGGDILTAPAAHRACVLNRVATVMSPCGLVNCKAFGPAGPLLTNRMTELVTYGSVGGVGRNPGPYPAANPAITPPCHAVGQFRRFADRHRSTERITLLRPKDSGTLMA
jgi:hypothetical protein